MDISKLKKLAHSLIEKAELSSTVAQSKLKDCPRGDLCTEKRGDKIRYFCRENKKVYLNNKQQSEIKKLEEKAYYSSLLKAAEKEKQTLNKVLKLLDKCPDTESVFLNIPEEKRNLIKSIYSEMSENRVKQFNKFKLAANNTTQSHFKTLNGEYVKSKSELIIADRLQANGISYAYESGVLMDNTVEVWHPDFSVLNKNTGKVFYWEHFGMMDNPEYLNNFQYKLERFAKKGIFPGESLIITTESSSRPLDTNYVDLLIKHYLE